MNANINIIITAIQRRITRIKETGQEIIDGELNDLQNQLQLLTSVN